MAKQKSKAQKFCREWQPFFREYWPDIGNLYEELRSRFWKEVHFSVRSGYGIEFHFKDETAIRFDMEWHDGPRIIPFDYSKWEMLQQKIKERQAAKAEPVISSPVDSRDALVERLEALEEAAKICDDLETKSNRPSRCAKAIRALAAKEQQP